MRRHRAPSPRLLAHRSMLIALAETIVTTRSSLGWTQAELAQHCGMSPSMVSLVERGLAPDVSVGTVARLCDPMGIKVSLATEVPFLADRRQQREPAHARCVAFTQRRLERAGWAVEREVEIVHGASRGWIDLLAFHPGRGMLLVIEVKTELHDIGQIERTVGWYERSSWTAGRRFGWQPSGRATVLLVLATEINDARIRANREILAVAFAARATTILPWVADPAGAMPGGRRGLALIDPLSRRQTWLRRAGVDGGRTPAPYHDYAEFMRVLRRGRQPRSTR